jgi:ABC-type uncharacterized transport system auxiliary subunit
MRGLFVIVLLAFVSTLSGCLSRSPISKQTFAFNVPAPVASDEAAGNRVVGVRRLEIAPLFDGRALVYRTGENAYERDPYAEFLGSPAGELAASVGGLLVQDGCFGAATSVGSALKPDVLVEVYVSELYGDIRQPGSPAAVLAIQVVFTEAKNGMPGKVILQRSYSRRIPIKSTTPAALMEGWNQGMIEIFAQVASDFQNQRVQ